MVLVGRQTADLYAFVSRTRVAYDRGSDIEAGADQLPQVKSISRGLSRKYLSTSFSIFQLIPWHPKTSLSSGSKLLHSIQFLRQCTKHEVVDIHQENGLPNFSVDRQRSTLRGPPTPQKLYFFSVYFQL